MLKMIFVMAALFLGVIFGSAGPVLADSDIGIGLGGNGGYDQPGVHYVRDGGISCRQGARIVRSAGFRGVTATNCSGRTFEYRGYRRDRLFQISVLSGSGRIIRVQRLRGGGGWGGDDYDDYDDYDDSEY